MILVETAEIGDEKIAAQSIAGTDPQLTGKISFSGKDSFSLVEHGKGRLYMLEEKLSLRSQDDPFGAAHKQSIYLKIKSKKRKKYFIAIRCIDGTKLWKLIVW